MPDIPRTMRGVHLTGHGDLDKLAYRDDIPVPRPGRRDVLIKVAAAGVNNTDINTRAAWYAKRDGESDDGGWSDIPLTFPRIQGADVCGRIVAVGADVAQDRLGERVIVEPCLREAGGEALKQPWYLGSECDGGFAEYVVVAARHAHLIESTMSDIELASFPCSYSTAENMLIRSQVGAKDRVLVTGASGGVGSAAVQLAKARDAYVIAVTNPAKAAEVQGLGADQTLAREDNILDALGHNSVDVVLDLVAGDQWPLFLDVLRPGGRYAVSGAIGGAMVNLDVRTLYLKDLSFFGCTVLEPETFTSLIGHIESRSIGPAVAATYPLSRITEAQAVFQSKQHTGKIVLTVDSPD
jgi:NADPH:quinone reductase-like Zn-dependent oxidoreductase